MKKIIFSLIAFMMFWGSVSAADCSEEERARLTTLANNVEITFEVQETADDGFESVGLFRLIIANLDSELYIYDVENDMYFFPEDADENGYIVVEGYDSEANFYVYGNGCYNSLRTIKVEVPKYNTYANDPLCEGIDPDDLNVCHPWFQHNLSYEAFARRVAEYKESLTHSNDNEDDINIIDTIFDFIVDNLVYIISGVVIIVVVVIAVMVHRKRSVLE